MNIVANTQPLRLLAAVRDPNTGAIARLDWPVLAWHLPPGRPSEPIAVQSLRGITYAILDVPTGRAEIPGGASFATADEAWAALVGLARARGGERQ
jgi:hypothetical protein